ncbi:MAG: CPBP family glutamic-type intramembrane protease [Pseudomonadota bacterium]
MPAKLHSILTPSAVIDRMAAYCARELREFAAFLARPRRAKHVRSTTREFVNRVAFFFLATLLVNLTVSLLVNLIASGAGIQRKNILEAGIFMNVAGIAVLVPVIEELVFRAGLRTAVWNLLVIPLFVLAMVGGLAVFACAAAILVAIVAVMAWRARNAGLKRKMARDFIRNYPRIFFLNCFLFGIVHVTNFEFVGTQAALAFILVLPMTLGATVLGYLRMRDGLGSSIYLHGLNNLLAVGLLLAMR